ncbi:GYD domain-containing protein [Gammaproteobacteria bacterium]|nr:GYD domain-containing protein [Gammaproteobacteria bacterium]
MTLIRSLILAGLACVAVAVQADNVGQRYFMFIGEPNAKAWQYLIDNPADRKVEVESAFAALGGEVISYYFGLGNGKNYITVAIPNDNELVQAIYLMRLPSGMLTSYEVIELMPSDQMSEALKKAKALMEADTTANN